MYDASSKFYVKFSVTNWLMGTFDYSVSWSESSEMLHRWSEMFGFELYQYRFILGCIFLELWTILEAKYKDSHTNTRDSVSRVSHMTRAVERSFSVGTVGISVTVVSKMKIFIWYLVRRTLVHIWRSEKVQTVETEWFQILSATITQGEPYQNTCRRIDAT